MNRIWITVVLCLVLVSCESKVPQGTADIGQKAPDFAIKDLNGKTISLATFQNRVVLIEFWATWCPPCITSIPELVQLQKDFDEKDFVILAVSVDEGRNLQKRLAEFASEHGMTYPVTIGDDLTSRLYGVVSIPVMFLLDRQHVIVKKYTGYSTGIHELLSADIKKLI